MTIKVYGIHKAMVDAGVTISHREGALYARVCEASETLVAQYESKGTVTKFMDPEGIIWFNIPFAYLPEPGLCTCHTDGTCACLAKSVRDGRGKLYCKVCGETADHCPCGCVCEGEGEGEDK